MQQLCFALYPLITRFSLSWLVWDHLHVFLSFSWINIVKQCSFSLCGNAYQGKSDTAVTIVTWVMVFNVKMKSVLNAFCVYQRGPDHAVKYQSMWVSLAWQIGTRTQRRQSLESLRTKSKLNGCLGVSTAYTSHELTAWFLFFFVFLERCLENLESVPEGFGTIIHSAGHSPWTTHPKGGHT